MADKPPANVYGVSAWALTIAGIVVGLLSLSWLGNVAESGGSLLGACAALAAMFSVWVAALWWLSRHDRIAKQQHSDTIERLDDLDREARLRARGAYKR